MKAIQNLYVADLLQWNLYNATTKFCGLSEQVVSHDRKNKHDFVKSLPDKSWNLYISVRLRQFYYTSISIRVSFLENLLQNVQVSLMKLH